MNDGPSLLARLATSIRRHERAAILGWSVAAFGLISFCIADAAFLGFADRTIAAWSGRWRLGIDDAESMLAEGRVREAADVLERLESSFPARHAKHALDAEMSRLLRLRAKAEAAIGRRRQERRALERLVAFDPRDHAGHWALAECLIRQGRNDDAIVALNRCLEIDPAHGAAVAALVRIHADAADFAGVRRTIEDYVSSPVLREFACVEQGSEHRSVAAADGTWHRFSILPATPAPNAAEIRFETHGRPFELRAITVVPLREAGRIAPSPRDPESVALEPHDADAAMRWVPKHEDDVAELRISHPNLIVGEIAYELRLLVPVDAATWDRVERAHRNLLADRDLELLRTRVLISERVE